MASLSATLLGPATWWMQRTRVPAKLLLIGSMLIVPLMVVTALTSAQVLGELHAVQLERQGVGAIRALTGTAVQLQLHRGLTSRAQSGDAQAPAALEAARQPLRDSLARLDAQILAVPELSRGLGTEWGKAREHIEALAAGQHAAQRQQAFAEHSAEIERLRQFALQIGDHSGLLLDARIDTVHLTYLAVQQIVPWTEQIGRARGLGVALIARGETSAGDRATLLGRADALTDALADLRLREGAMTRAGMHLPAAWPAALAATQDFESRIRQVFAAQVLDTTPDGFFAQGSQAIQAVMALNAEVVDDLEHRLQEREQRLRLTLGAVVGGSLLGLALMFYLASAFYRSFIGALRVLQRGVTATADGDLSTRVLIRGRDELAEIGQAVEGMSARLSAMVADIRSSAVRVGLAGQQVAISSESLSQRTHAQADSLRQTSATVTQLSDAVASNAEAAQALDQLTDALRSRAEAGGQAMRETVASMSALEAGSRRVAEIIGVIDGIAFQTNILALNAAVEAARAGEAGRGFAVVAAEVRQLALRSSTASAEIRQLITQSSSQVNESSARIQQVGATLDAVLSGVRDVSGRLRHIAQASAQQSAGLAEVSQSVGNLDELTKQNATMVQESSAAADDLVTRAAALSDAVAAIRLRQGSADEATRMVERAVALIEQKGLEAAATVFRQPDGGYRDRDLYVFVTDREGRYQVHGAKPAMEGHRVHELPGIDGERFARESWAATTGSHWVEYDILNPETGQVQPKASYVVALNERLLIGCGIYQVASD